MVKPTKFTKIAAGGRDKGDISLNAFGMVPVIQKSVGVSAGVLAGGGTDNFRIGIVPDDGADVLEILTIVPDDSGVDNGLVLDFGTSANASAFGVIVVSAAGRYLLPIRNVAQIGVAVAHGSAFSVDAGTSIIVQPSSSEADFICYTTFLQNKTTDF